MFSERLENLIKASLQDGFLTDQEKQAILKRAEAEGEDPNEVDIYIQSLMQKSRQIRKQKESEKDDLLAKKKKEETGRVCPQCGKQVPPLTLKCECGFEFTAPENKRTSVQELSDKLESILATPMKHKNPDTDSYKAEKKEREEQVLNTISLFPVPNTKEDIIEFLALSAPNSKKKGGILGTKVGRILAFLAAVAVIVIFILLFVPNTPPTKDGDMSTHGIIFTILLWLFLGGIIPICLINDETLAFNKKADVWRAKFEQVLMKGRRLRGDPEFQRQLDYYENIVNNNRIKIKI